MCVFISITIGILLSQLGLMRPLGLGKYLNKMSNKTDHNLNFEGHFLLHKYFQFFTFHSRILPLFHTEEMYTIIDWTSQNFVMEICESGID